MKRLLGIDVGTTAVKAGLYDEELRELSSHTLEYSLRTEGALVEADAEAYVGLVLACAEKACGGLIPDAVSIDTQCETLIVTDGDGVPLRKAIVWLDNRAVREAEELEAVFGRRTVYETTGQPEIAAAWPACKLLWIKRHEPEIFSAVRKIFLLGDWLIYRLTGEFVTEGTLQSSTLYFDIRRGDWWEEMLSCLGITRQMLPRIGRTTERVGVIQGVPLILGAMDQVAGSVGAGAVSPGVITEMTGTTLAVLSPCKEIPPYREGSIIPCHVHWDGGYCRLLWTSAAGLALRWFRDGFCEGKSFGELDLLAEGVPPGAEGVTFVPHLCGSAIPDFQPDATAAFCGLRLCHGRAQLIRAVMESVAFMLKDCLDAAGGEIRQLRSVGGGSNSPLWCRIKADVTGRELLTLKDKECATRGSAIFAGVGIGVFPSVREAAGRIATDARYLPTGADYTDAYRRYRRFCRRVNPPGREE